MNLLGRTQPGLRGKAWLEPVLFLQALKTCSMMIPQCLLDGAKLCFFFETAALKQANK